jgi:hypothetical protein
MPGIVVFCLKTFLAEVHAGDVDESTGRNDLRRAIQ